MCNHIDMFWWPLFVFLESKHTYCLLKNDISLHTVHVGTRSVLLIYLVFMSRKQNKCVLSEEDNVQFCHQFAPEWCTHTKFIPEDVLWIWISPSKQQSLLSLVGNLHFSHLRVFSHEINFQPSVIAIEITLFCQNVPKAVIEGSKYWLNTWHFVFIVVLLFLLNDYTSA